jgi:hypothetical protein
VEVGVRVIVGVRYRSHHGVGVGRTVRVGVGVGVRNGVGVRMAEAG